MRAVRGTRFPCPGGVFCIRRRRPRVPRFVLRQPETGPIHEAGDLFQFLASVFLMYQPVKNLSQFLWAVATGRAAGDRIQEVLETPVDIAGPDTGSPGSGRGDSLDRIAFWV